MHIQLHYHKSYRKALRKLDTQSIGQIQQAVMDFEDNPKSPGLNFERLYASDFCSIRASRDLRIILAPLEGEEGRHWLLAYVDHHDPAYDWAKRTQLSYTEATQTYDLLQVAGEEILQAQEPANQADFGNNGSIWQAWNDKQLIALGVGEPLIPFVKGVKSEQDLEALKAYLPEVTVEALAFALMGEAPSTVQSYVEEGKVKLATDPGPSEVLASPNSQRNVTQLRRTDELERFYHGEFADWMVYLHHTQRRLADGEFNGPVKVTGGAGTGKTVVALHRAKYLQDRRRDNRPVFFTTFNRNLAENLADSFQQLGLDQVKITLNNIHSWMLTYAKDQIPLREGKWWVVELSSKLNPADYWQQAIEATDTGGYEASFLAEEYRDVLLYHDLREEADYLATNRQGRGRPLSVGQRREVWTLMQTYQELLDAAGYLHLGRVANELARYLAAHPEQRPFSHVIVDEVQDFGMPELRLIRQLTDEGANDLFLTGDPLQKIYRTRFRFSHGGISVRGQRSQRLRINYRTSEEIRQAATGVITGLSFEDFDGGEVKADDSYSLFRGEEPRYRSYESDEAELESAIEDLKNRYQAGIALDEMCMAGFHSNTVKRIVAGLHGAGVPYYDLRKGKGTVSGIRISSLHGMKGMEFRAVYLLAMGKDQYPHRFRNFGDLSETEQAAELKGQQALLYVAMSRARDYLWLSGVDAACRWIAFSNH